MLRTNTKDYIVKIRYILPLCVGLICFGNHYIRDSVGALEKQLEHELSISPGQYALLNSLFFAPNIIAPFVAGVFEKKLGGGANTMLLSLTIANVGHFIFCLGAQNGQIPMMFLGRTLAGCMYEVIDTMAVVVTGPHYQSSWGALCGIINGFIRLGSVFNFLLSPMAFKYGGVKCALWLAFLVSFIGNFSAIYLKRCDNILISSVISKEMSIGNYDNCPLQEEALVSNSTSSNSVSSICCGRSEDENSLSSREMEGNNGRVDDKNSSSIKDSKDTSKHNVQSSSSNSSNDDNSSWCGNIFPFRELSLRYYYYVLCGTCLYGSMVPFWFMGGKYLQDYYHMDVTSADSLMLLPEGAIVVVSLPLGLILDRYKWSLSFKLSLLSYSCLLLPFSYFLLCIGCNGDDVTIPPIISMGLLGLGYAFSNSVFWAIITLAIGNQNHLGIASGLVSSSLNLLPTLIPPLVTRFIGLDDGKSYLFVLSLSGIAGFAFALLSACSCSDGSTTTDVTSTQLEDREARGQFSEIACNEGSSHSTFDESNETSMDGYDFEDSEGIELTRSELGLMKQLTNMIEGTGHDTTNSEMGSHSGGVRYLKVSSSEDM